MAREQRRITIGELCDRGDALIQTGPFGSQLHSHEYREFGTPVVPTEAIGRRRISLRDLPRVSEEVAARLARHKLIAGDILFARRGAQATGSSALVERSLEGGLCGTGAILLRVRNRNELDPVFLSFALCAQSSIQWLKDHAVGAVMPNLNSDVIRRLSIPLPPLDDQLAIAGFLGALDAKIELNAELNETLEAMARALFKSWFVDFDPVHAKAAGRAPIGMDAETAKLFPSEFVDSDVGRIPKGWPIVRVGSLVQLEKGLSYKGEGLGRESGVPMVALGCFGAHGFDPSKLKVYEGDCRDRHFVPPGELVVANTDITQKRVTLGMPGIVPRVQGHDRLLFTHHVYAARRLSGVAVNWVDFLLQLLRQEAARERIAGYATGTTVLALPREAILELGFAQPPAPLVEQFASFASSCREKVDCNLAESVTLAKLRDELLPRLLSGAMQVRS